MLNSQINADSFKINASFEITTSFEIIIEPVLVTPSKPREQRQEDYLRKLRDITLPILKEIKFKDLESLAIRFSKPIDPTMAWANHASVNVCPFFFVDLQSIPKEFRPTGPDDPRLYELAFVQELSDWIALEYGLARQTVGMAEAATVKTILKLRENPVHFNKALRAGLVHELGHVALGHSQKLANDETALSTGFFGKVIDFCSNYRLLDPIGQILKFNQMAPRIKENEREADLYAVTHLKDGAEGIKIGFNAWQQSLKDIRANIKLNWKERLLTKVLITPKGNLVPLLFTHGSFEDRIHRSEVAEKLKLKCACHTV